MLPRKIFLAQFDVAYEIENKEDQGFGILGQPVGFISRVQKGEENYDLLLWSTKTKQSFFCCSR